ncbi:septation protein SepH [Bifidobacterium magnum]|uniref:DUF3071 domain-containing protein n=1 Tax=Bifidobacterium magnum TaxID=1692 RepID=A0A087BC94_9BIFI|nr:septation protein SepH [Bifidobacterium magnum]KFI68644.1 hypothetical protein BMAGN_0510 [Bifidobacterium magnum]
MSGEPESVAQFNGVTPSGQLVFTAGGREFLVEVDETLNKAVATANRILSNQTDNGHAPIHQPSLPIPQIQSLIRAGADPERVAKRFGVSVEQVHRFSASVQTEKNFAVQQFLRVKAPKESGAHTLSELMERSLTALQVRPDSVQWSATRRGHEPWRITATFRYQNRVVIACWAWNMNDNAVVCENDPACRLLCETPDNGADQASSYLSLPESMAEMVAAPATSPLPPQQQYTHPSAAPYGEPGTVTTTVSQEHVAMTSMEVAVSESVPEETAEADEVSQPAASAEPSEPVAAPETTVNPEPEQEAQTQPPEEEPAAAEPSPLADKPALSQTVEPYQPKRVQSTQSSQPVQPMASPTADLTATEETPMVHATHTDSASKTSRRSNRNPMPSWDEILFGK